MDSTVAAWISGIATVVFAFAGLLLIVREVRRKERIDAQRTIDGLDRMLIERGNEAINCHGYVYTLRVLCADRGIETPEPPPLVDIDVGPGTLLPGVGGNGDRNRWFRRRRGSGPGESVDHVDHDDDTVEFHIDDDGGPDTRPSG